MTTKIRILQGIAGSARTVRIPWKDRVSFGAVTVREAGGTSGHFRADVVGLSTNHWVDVHIQTTRDIAPGTILDVTLEQPRTGRPLDLGSFKIVLGDSFLERIDETLIAPFVFTSSGAVSEAEHFIPCSSPFAEVGEEVTTECFVYSPTCKEMSITTTQQTENWLNLKVRYPAAEARKVIRMYAATVQMMMTFISDEYEINQVAPLNITLYDFP